MIGSNGKGKKTMAQENVLNTISRGTVVEGKIHTKGDIRVEGRIVGTVTCEAKLVIGEHGYIEGFVEARNAYVAGRVKGELVVKELLQLQEKANIEGNIFTQKLSVQVGAEFSGNCQMGEAAKAGGQKARSRALENGGRKVSNLLSPGHREDKGNNSLGEAKASA